MRNVTEISGDIRPEERMISLGRVSAGIAHEIRNPLSTINVYTQMLRTVLSEHEDSETMNDILDEIESATERIETVVKRVMDFARHRKPELTLADINNCIRDAVALSSVNLNNEGIFLQTDLDGNIPNFHFENQSIMQVLLNIISNGADAMKSTAPPKQMSISSYLMNDSVIVKIVDSGPGIMSEDRERIFDPFFTTKHTGLGIGLSLCDRIVSDHNGNLTVSNNHRGTEFCITLPLEKISMANSE